MRPARGGHRVRVAAILLALCTLGGPLRAFAEQAPREAEPPGIVVEMGPAEPPAPSAPAQRPAPRAPAQPGATTPPTASAIAGEIRALRERVEALERTLTGLLEALPVVASGVVSVPPSARQLADPVANPLGFARLEPGQATVRHGLGAVEVTIYLSVVSPEGRVSYQVHAGGLFANAPSPPDGTFTIYNATEGPLAVRWLAILHRAAGEGAPSATGP